MLAPGQSCATVLCLIRSRVGAARPSRLSMLGLSLRRYASVARELSAAQLARVAAEQRAALAAQEEGGQRARQRRVPPAVLVGCGGSVQRVSTVFTASSECLGH